VRWASQCRRLSSMPGGYIHGDESALAEAPAGSDDSELVLSGRRTGSGGDGQGAGSRTVGDPPLSATAQIINKHAPI
jgi:hypothetical protein